MEKLPNDIKQVPKGQEDAWLDQQLAELPKKINKERKNIEMLAQALFSEKKDKDRMSSHNYFRLGEEELLPLRCAARDLLRVVSVAGYRLKRKRSA